MKTVKKLLVGMIKRLIVMLCLKRLTRNGLLVFSRKEWMTKTEEEDLGSGSDSPLHLLVIMSLSRFVLG